jgi:hypothetical protein
MQQEATTTKEDTVKKAWLVVALTALTGVVANTFADVQNIRLSGDVRLRGYYLADAGPDNVSNDSFIAQRTRVSVEADLEDHVLVVATMSAENLWGGSGSGSRLSGATVSDQIGLVEGYVQLNEVFYSAATLKLGRQHLHYGHGLILSSVEQEYNYDAARLVLDYYPLTIDLIASKIASGSSFGVPSAPDWDTNLLFANARYEMTDSLIKNIEGYLGYLSSRGASGMATPLIVGVRSDMNLTEGLNTYAEVAHEFGDAGAGAADDLSAWLINVGGSFSFKDTQWAPVVNGSWTWASGGGATEHNFVPWFDYVEGYNGYLAAPALSNIHILNLGGSVKPCENTTVSLQAYYYMMSDSDGVAFSNSAVDFGGLPIIGTATSISSSKEIGWEFDTIVGYDYSKDVRCQLVYALFVPGTSVHTATSFDAVAHEVRGELNVKF